MICSLIFIVTTLVLAKIFIKDESKKDTFFKIFALLTLGIHISSIYSSFFKGQIKVEESIIWPIYPCNVSMWLFVVLAFMKNKKGKAFKIIAEFNFFLGIIGGVIGIMFNEIYSNNPNLLQWDVLKGLLSHTTLLVSSFYLLVGGYIKIGVHNVLSVLVGLGVLLVDGGLIIGIYRLAGKTPPNAMYLLEKPFANLPWVNTWTLGLIAIILVFVIGVICENVFEEKEDRWYSKLRRKTKWESF